MKTIAYFDCPTGISGDMCLGALLDAGVPLDYMRHQLGKLGLDAEYTLSVQPVLKRGQRARQAKVRLIAGEETASRVGNHPPGPGDHLTRGHGHSGHSHAETEAEALRAGNSSTPGSSPARHLSTIEGLITEAALPQRVKDWSLAIFRCLGEAEADVHGISVDQVHFHEVGATDAIVDIVGTCLGLDYLNIETLVCSPLPTGLGRVNTAHGWLPVPAPAVLKLMEIRQVPLYSHGLEGELVTPTGAAIVTTLAQRFGEPPPLTLKQIGLGAGSKDLPVANILRLWIGQALETGAISAPTTEIVPFKAGADEADGAPGARHPTAVERSPVGDPAEQNSIIVLETQVDDLIPQAVGHLYDRLFEAGALDVFVQAIQMKKSRPGLLITVLCPPSRQQACERVLFTETTTLGIRHRRQPRTVLRRGFQPVETPYGAVSMKLAFHPQGQQLMNAHPEYEDCAELARRYRLPWQVVYRAALVAWEQEQEASLPG
jgi:uncharacterized protein (TIGR00299 family) protein